MGKTEFEELSKKIIKIRRNCVDFNKNLNEY